MKRGHIPVRMCVVCRSRRPKQALLKVNRGIDGKLFYDREQKLGGRSAYICPQCIQSLRKAKRAMEYSLKTNIKSAEVEALIKELEALTIEAS